MQNGLMKRLGLILSLFILCGGIIVHAQPSKIVAFYNVENLFDTINDPGTDDGDFTPEGLYRWTETRYQQKIHHIALVIASLEQADLVGLAEVENHRVLDDLIASAPLKALGYDYVHFDSPDTRGIDVALLYRPQRFRIESMQPLSLHHLPHYRTRDLLHVSGLWDEMSVQILVCHLPSIVSHRRVRQRAAESLHYTADSILRTYPEKLLLVMGDFNNNPDSRLMGTITGNAKKGSAILENPFRALYQAGIGSYCYRDRWNMYDSILIGGDTTPVTERQAEVFVRPELIQSEGRYAGYPFRTFSGHNHLGGYSDHLPVRLILK